MPVYVWKGVNSYGEKRKGKIEAHSEAAALSQLKKIRIKPDVLKEAPKDIPESVRYPGFSLKIVGREKISTPRPPKIYILPAYCW